MSAVETSSRCGAAGAHQTKNGFLDLPWSRTMLSVTPPVTSGE